MQCIRIYVHIYMFTYEIKDFVSLHSFIRAHMLYIYTVYIKCSLNVSFLLSLHIYVRHPHTHRHPGLPHMYIPTYYNIYMYIHHIHIYIYTSHTHIYIHSLYMHTQTHIYVYTSHTYIYTYYMPHTYIYIYIPHIPTHRRTYTQRPVVYI